MPGDSGKSIESRGCQVKCVNFLIFIWRFVFDRHIYTTNLICAEQYKKAKRLTGKQIAELFSRYRVWEYIYSCYEALHTTGTNYIIEDIDLYIEARRPPMA